MPPAPSPRPSPPGPGRLRLHSPGPAAQAETRWVINGHLASILVWTAQEWGRLAERPGDAVQAGNGVWCALRMD